MKRDKQIEDMPTDPENLQNRSNQDLFENQLLGRTEEEADEAKNEEK